MAKKNNQQAASQEFYNVPNSLTGARFVLAIMVCIFLGIGQYQMAMIMFVIAASTDWVDGYYARKYNQVTQVGRVFDPFVDKILICGVFVMLAAEPGSGIAAWVAVVVVGRELLVTALRGYMESIGIDFSAKWSGKWKMVLQCVAAVASMFTLMQLARFIATQEVTEDHIGRFGEVHLEAILTGPNVWLYWTLVISVWAAVVLTVYSGLVYVLAAAKHLRK